MVFILVTSEPIPFPAIALLTLVLQVLLGVAPADVIASSFMNDAVLFVMGSLMFAIAIVHQGLDIRLELFFSQAEDGIRDRLVTGVQTCGLPVSPQAFGWQPLHFV